MEEVLHVLQDHSSSPIYLNLFIGLGKVTRKDISEALDVGQFDPVDVTPPKCRDIIKSTREI